MSDKVLSATGLSIGYTQRGKETLIAGPLDLALYAGSMVCLLGPNGAGKSTLMRTLSGLQPALGGNVLLDGRSLHQMQALQMARTLSVVLSDKTDTGNLTVREVVALGRTPYTNWLGMLSDQDERIIHDAMDDTGVLSFADRKIHRLSDGERQRVMLARALAQDTPVIFLDEPTAHLDLTGRIELMHLLRHLAHQNGKAVLLTTHDLDLALHSADKLWLVHPTAGFCQGTPEDLILNGAFEKVFVKNGFRFDKTTGSFQFHEPQQGEAIFLTGQGEAVFWTKRALIREGFAISLQPEAIRVHAGGDEWQLQTPNQSSRHSTVSGLLAALQPFRNNAL